ncbi:MAG: hypothetical protein C4547_09130 [Phycisphaerales bacterium]|nr:MAG: hypothetical protein C4547_09130 [Phycisphaerales bacterium]
MLKATVPLLLLIAATAGSRANGQDSARDQAMQQIQRQQTLQPADDGIVQAWVEATFRTLLSGGEPRAFLAAIAHWRDDPQSTSQFVGALARECARQAAAVFTNAEVTPAASAAVATALSDFGERVPMDVLLTGLRSPVAGTRFLMARSVASRRATYGTNPTQLASVATAVISAAASETEPIVVAWLYKCLTVPGSAANAAVLDHLITVFHGRVEARRAGASFIDGAENEFLEYIRGSAAALPQNERNRLLPDLATYLRAVGERYAASDIGFREQVNAERALDAVEAVLAGITATPGGVRTALAQGPRTAVLEAVQQAIVAWIGDEATAGVLNGGNYGVERGAP